MPTYAGPSSAVWPSAWPMLAGAVLYGSGHGPRNRNAVTPDYVPGTRPSSTDRRTGNDHQHPRAR